MVDQALAAATGDDRVDGTLRAIVTIFDMAFPDRVRGYYVIGSYADGSGSLTSDVDLAIVFAGRFADSERERAERLSVACATLSVVELDAEVVAEEDLALGASPMLKRASLLIAGTDTRAAMPLVPLPAWVRDRMHTSYWRVVRLFDRLPAVRLPLDYPDPADEFYGYLRRTVRLPSGAEVLCTRDLIRMVIWAATGLLALRAGIYAARKGECPALYRAHIGDEWAAYLDALYTCCHDEWHYLIPTRRAERQRLRALCGRTRDFENAFLRDYRDYALDELLAGDATARLHTLEMLGEIPLVDDAVGAAIAALAGDAAASEPVRVAAAVALERLAEGSHLLAANTATGAGGRTMQSTLE